MFTATSSTDAATQAASKREFEGSKRRASIPEFIGVQKGEKAGGALWCSDLLHVIEKAGDIRMTILEARLLILVTLLSLFASNIETKLLYFLVP